MISRQTGTEVNVMRKICGHLEKVLYAVAMCSVALFFLCTSLQVFSRAAGINLPFTEELANAALHYRDGGNIGVAFTYNEPFVGYEYVRDTARLVHERGMYNVMVTNGTAELSVYEELSPYIDAMNIDLKGFTEHYYKDLLKGDLGMVKALISEAVKHCHVELTTLIIPGENDSEEEMREMCEWISELKDANGDMIGQNLPLHVSRFHPCFHMTDRHATDIEKVYRLAEVAREKLRYVYTGNC